MTVTPSEKAYRPYVGYCTWYQVQYCSSNGQTTEQIRSIPKQQRMPKMAFLVATTVPMNTSSTTETHQPTNQPQTEAPTTYLYRIRRIDLIFSVLRIFTTLSAILDLWRRVLLQALFLKLNDIDLTSRRLLY
jgi:hypothetical protein